MGRTNKLPIVFLDRDGTIIVDKIYLNNPQEVEFINGVIDGLKRIVLSGYKIVIVTNQSGIARGYVKEENLHAIHKKIIEVLKSNDIDVYRIYYCPHLPEDNCNCRKPKIGMVKEILHLVDKENSFMVGDKDTDIGFGKNLGIKTILISNNPQITYAADYVVDSFEKAVKIILQHKIKK